MAPIEPAPVEPAAARLGSGIRGFLRRAALPSLWWVSLLVAGGYVVLEERRNSPPGPPSLDPEYHLDLGEVELRHGRSTQAAERFRVARDLAANPDMAGRAERGLARSKIAGGDLEAGTAHLALAIELVPEERRAEIGIELAAVLATLSRPVEAEREIDRALAWTGTPRETLIRAHRALLELYRARPASLVTKIESRIAANPGDRWSLAFLGDLYADVLGRPEKAILVYERLLELEPENGSVLDRLLRLSIEVADTERQIRFGERLVPLLERDLLARFEVLRTLARACASARQFDRAVLLLEESRSLAPSSERSAVWTEIFRIEREAGKLGERIARLEKDKAYGHLWLVYTQVEPDPSKALEAAQKMHESSPDDPMALWLVVEAALFAGDLERVKESAVRLLARQGPEARRAVFAYASAMDLLDRAEEGVATLSKAAAENADVAAVSYVAIATLDPAGGEAWREKALEAARRSNDPRIFLLVAERLRAAGDPARALRAARLGLETSPREPERSLLAWESVLSLSTLGDFRAAEDLCRSIAADLSLPAELRRAAERKLVEILQAQGRPVRIESGK